eukprot:jgi/Astpho2/8572/fgenesh1_pg.00126_%23_3_t
MTGGSNIPNGVHMDEDSIMLDNDSPLAAGKAEAWEQAMLAGGAFHCHLCCGVKPLLQLAAMECQCMICEACISQHVTRCLQKLTDVVSSQVGGSSRHKSAAAVGECPHSFAKGQLVWYTHPDGRCVPATVVHIDVSIQPPSYGVQLGEDTGSYRETEAKRLRPKQVNSDTIDLSQWPLPQPQQPTVVEEIDLIGGDCFDDGCCCCPVQQCRVPMLPGQLQAAAPEAFSVYSSAATQAAIRADQRIITFRCPACSQTFCDQCRAIPYHTDLTCEQNRAPQCLYCRQRMMDTSDGGQARLNVRQLRKGIGNRGVAHKWCLERLELEMLHHHLQLVCRGEECSAKLRQACLRRLPCGHLCGGVRGEEAGHCLGCLQGFPGPAISFNFLNCVNCGNSDAQRAISQEICCAEPLMQHPALREWLRRPLELRQETVSKAKQRLKVLPAGWPQGTGIQAKHGLQAEGLMADPALSPGGPFDGRPGDFALSKLNFYQCSRVGCQRVYYGGRKECRAQAAEEDAAGQAGGGAGEELLCGSCAGGQGAAACSKHGSEFIEYKCRFCCRRIGILPTRAAGKWLYYPGSKQLHKGRQVQAAFVKAILQPTGALQRSRNAEEALLTLKSVSTDLLAAQHAILSITSSSSFARRRSFSQPFGSHLHAAAGIGVDTSRVSSEMLPEKVQDANKRIMLLKSENTRLRMQIQGLLSTASRSKQQEVFTMPSLQVKRVSSSQLSNASPAFGSMPEMRGSTRTSITFEPTEEEEEGDEDSMTFWTAEELPDNDPTVLRASSWRHPAIVSAGNGKRPNTAGALLDFLKNKVLFFGNGMGKLLSGTRTPPRTTGSDSGTFATASHSRRSTASSPAQGVSANSKMSELGGGGGGGYTILFGKAAPQAAQVGLHTG